MAHDIFISHSSKEKVITDQICSVLEQTGFKCWLSERDLPSGVLYVEALVDAINDCALVIVILSSNSNESPFVLSEINTAFSRKIPILPIRVENVPISKPIGFLILNYQIFDAFPNPIQTYFPSLIETVKARLAKTPEEISDDKNPLRQNKKLKIVLLYKRDAQQDVRLLTLLESYLTNLGHSIFIDRNMTIGVKWAQEIEEQLRTSDAVIPLISEYSIKSEMLEYEVQVANAASQDQNGRPRIIPIRVNYYGPLPHNLASILDSRQYFSWKSPEDDQQLTEEVVQALQTPLRRWKDKDELEAVGGAVPIDSKYYVERVVDVDFMRAVSQQEPIVLIKGARQMGKTSLLARGLRLARERDSKVVLTDFQKFNAAQLETVEAFFIALGEMLADQLGLSVYPQDRWNSRRGANLNFDLYMRREILGNLNQPLLWAMDEVDRLFNRDYKSEVFGLFRSWHNERALDPGGPWGNLTLAIVYATEAHHFITDINQSPFNVGLRLELEDFTQEQVADLNRRHGSPLQEGHEVLAFYKLTGGQPYLVRRGLYELVAHHMLLSDFSAKADQDNGPYGDHLRRIYITLVKNPSYSKIMTEILNGETCSDSEGFYWLRSVGILAGNSSRDAQPRNQIYATYLRRLLQ
jgi:hypothetical protein